MGMSNPNVSTELIDRLVEVRFDGKHGSAEATTTMLVRDTEANIDSLVKRISARDIWALDYLATPASAASAWREMFDDDEDPSFEDAPEQ